MLICNMFLSRLICIEAFLITLKLIAAVKLLLFVYKNSEPKELVQLHGDKLFME